MNISQRFVLPFVLFGLCLMACSVAAVPVTASGNSLDRTQLPMGDGKVTYTPKAGYVMRCGPSGGGLGAGQAGPWIKSNGTFDLTAKINVQGNVSWISSLTFTKTGGTQTLHSNGLPNHKTGTFPVVSSDPAYQYDRNPNRIKTQNLSYTVPSTPTARSSGSCLGPGPVAILLTGAVVFDALDAEGRDAVAHELQDACNGHPEVTGTYHYHNLTTCLPDPGKGHSSLMGYALDGFGLYGVRGENGKALTNADLDECHGHTHVISWNGQTISIYHYHASYEYPYTISCFRGKSVTAQFR